MTEQGERMVNYPMTVIKIYTSVLNKNTFKTTNAPYLTTIAIRSRIRHTQNPRSIMRILHVLIGKRRCSIDTHLPCPIVIEKVTPLNHKIFHDSMEGGVFVSQGCFWKTKE